MKKLSRTLCAILALVMVFSLLPAFGAAAAAAGPDAASEKNDGSLAADEWYPEITKQPTSQTVKAGEKATFKIEGKHGNHTVSFTWLYMDAEEEAWDWRELSDGQMVLSGIKVSITRNGNVSTLTLPTKEEMNGWRICCRVWSPIGATLSEEAKLTVISPDKPTITTQPENATVDEGKTATFSVEAAGAKKYQWYSRTSSTGSWKEVSSASGKTATLKFTVKDRHNKYQYRCKVSNSSGSVYSKTVTLMVTSKPRIVTQPSDVFVAAGKTATIKVRASGPWLSHQWYYQKPGETTWTKVSHSGGASSYSFKAADRHDGYKYRCKISNSAGTVYSKAVTLTIVTTPEITAQPSNVTVIAGKTATFKFDVAGKGLSYQWYYHKPGGSGWTEVSINGTSAAYSLTTAARHNGNKYKCVVKNAAGSVTSSIVKLTVVSKPAIKTQPTSVTVAEGSAAAFKVTASGTALSYQWYYHKPGETEWKKVSINGTSATYSLTAAARHSGNSYRCEVKNDAGSVTSSTVTLTVVSKPLITSQPSSVTVAEGGSASFTVLATGENLSYQWYCRSSSSGSWVVCTAATATTPTHTPAALPKYSGYQYKCVVTSTVNGVSASVESDVVTLTVN